ncbi:MAG: hypothetical protein QOC60_1780 [Frankiaceae bacterium]|jgi:hypothetical protein|nr:hypothetical protein [Frankiaceae bacterium]MDQ1715835.1 hypothetical protein [Frankiaceae bacterium]
MSTMDMLEARVPITLLLDLFGEAPDSRQLYADERADTGWAVHAA